MEEKNSKKNIISLIVLCVSIVALTTSLDSPCKVLNASFVFSLGFNLGKSISSKSFSVSDFLSGIKAFGNKRAREDYDKKWRFSFDV